MSERAQPFIDMAARIDLNADNGFGGAFVIMPPGEEPMPKVMLMLNNADNPAMFWSSLMTTAQIALQELDEAEKKSQFGNYR